MRGREVTLWQDEREYGALQAALARRGTSVEAELTNALEALYRQEVPEAERQEIQEEIRAEELAEARRQEAARRFAAFHVTEAGQERWLRQDRSTKFLDAGISLYRYCKAAPDQRAPSLADALRLTEEISRAQFAALALERLEGTGRVTGVFDMDLDKGVCATLGEDGRWSAYAVKDVSLAAYRAGRKEHRPYAEMRDIFREYLKGRELPAGPGPVAVEGIRRLRAEDVTFGDTIEDVGGRLNFYMEIRFDADEVFGTHVETDTNDNYLCAYANYDLAAGAVCGALELTLCRGDGADVPLVYPLDESERAVLLEKMRDYCLAQTGQSLEDYAASLRMEDAPSEYLGPVMSM